jgi:hypothetical protein
MSPPLTLPLPLNFHHLFPPTTPHITYHLHASCFPIGRLPPCLPVHDQVIMVKAGRRVSYSRDGVRLALKSDTDRELSLSHRSMQIGSRTLQQTLLMQPVVSSGLQQLAGMPLLNTELCSVTPRPIFCPSQFLQCMHQFCLRDSSGF